MTEKLFTAEEVSSILGIHPHTLAVWRCTGRYNLPYVKTGRLVRYRESDLLAFIERGVKTIDSSFDVGC